MWRTSLSRDRRLGTSHRLETAKASHLEFFMVLKQSFEGKSVEPKERYSERGDDRGGRENIAQSRHVPQAATYRMQPCISDRTDLSLSQAIGVLQYPARRPDAPPDSEYNPLSALCPRLNLDPPSCRLAASICTNRPST